jgi:hypothetical protein
VRAKAFDDDLFSSFVLHIRKHGVTQRYMKKFYKYLTVGEWKYWTMGAPLEDTIIINRAKL